MDVSYVVHFGYHQCQLKGRYIPLTELGEVNQSTLSIAVKKL
jgi:hypothetical protein|tara:strand:- start:6378 stop:6503 length:126 start_codon:yes stop_codon:yes gene_type:complete